MNAQKDKSTHHQAQRPGGSAGRRVLVVDDNIDMAVSLAFLLEHFGHEVRMVHDGNAAIAMATEFWPEIVLLDIGLPGKTGLEVARELRAHGGFNNTLLIAVSGYGQAEDVRLSTEAGFNHHLVKPVDFKALAALLGAWSNIKADAP